MSRGTWEDQGSEEHRPVWDLLEVLERGPASYPRYVSLYPAETDRNRVALLFAGLAMGPPVGAVLREHLSRRDSKEKWLLAVGLGEMGFPEVEGYFARVLRERSGEGAMAAAVRALGKIRGPKSLPLVAAALEHPPVFEAACAALMSYGGPNAAAALLPRASQLPALSALADMGSVEALPLFIEALGQPPPWAAVGARGIGRTGRRESAGALVPLLNSDDEAVSAAAFEAYAQLGAPEGVQLLLQRVPESPPPWMVAVLGESNDSAVQDVLISLLSPPSPRGFLGRLLPWRRGRNRAEPLVVYRALRNTTDSKALEILAARLERETDPRTLRELAGIPALSGTEAGRAALTALWRREQLTARYFAARALLQAPEEDFLIEALDRLASPGFKPDEARSPLWDEAHALGVYAQDNGACLFVGNILDSDLVDLAGLQGLLAARLGAQAYADEAPPTQVLREPVDRSSAVFLQALAEASPPIREPLFRLLNLVAELETGGVPLLDIGLCLTGVHQGGIQRALYRSFQAALGRLLEGKDDRFLPALDRLTAHISEEGPLRPHLRALIEKARRALMAECRDMAVYSEGSPRGDMVLVEQLRGG